MEYTDEHQLMSMRASIIHLKTKPDEKAASLSALPTLKKTADDLMNPIEQLTIDVKNEKHRNEEMQQQIAEKDCAIQSLTAETQNLKSKIEEFSRFASPTNFSLLSSPTASTAKPHTSKFSPYARLQFPRFYPIAATLAEQRAQLAQTRAFVTAEWAAPVPSRLDRELCQQQAQALREFQAEVDHLKQKLCESETTVDSLTTHLDKLRTSLSEAHRSGVMAMDRCQHYLDKSQRQRKQLAEVQGSNGTMKRENSRLRAEVKELRDSTREWGGQVMKKSVFECMALNMPARDCRGTGMEEQDTREDKTAGRMHGRTESNDDTNHAGSNPSDLAADTAVSLLHCDEHGITSSQQLVGKPAHRQRTPQVIAQLTKKVKAVA